MITIGHKIMNKGKQQEGTETAVVDQKAKRGKMVLEAIKRQPRIWLITGVAGFIGSNLLETLLLAGQKVKGLDNFFTGYEDNLRDVRKVVGEHLWGNFDFINGDIRDQESCQLACHGVDHVLHQAALASVPLSMENPSLANDMNITGFLNMLLSAKAAGAKSFVYASSSAVYGDTEIMPLGEDITGRLLSPYAVTKRVNELYGQVLSDDGECGIIGLRYFNIFGKRQDPNGAYASVIPSWFSTLLNNHDCIINGPGDNTRDYCYIDNCVQANILASIIEDRVAWNRIYNVACGDSTSLSELFKLIRAEAAVFNPQCACAETVHHERRRGDIVHSVADIGKIKDMLGYDPMWTVGAGLSEVAKWYAENLNCED